MGKTSNLPGFRGKRRHFVANFVISLKLFIELNRLYTTQLAVVVLQLVTSATSFGLVWASSGLQRLVSIKVHNVAVPMGFHGNHGIPSVQQHHVPL